MSYLFILCLYAAICRGQNTGGSIEGLVLDAATLQPLSGANVFIESPKIGNTTDMAGVFKIDSVPDGSQQVNVRLMGYDPAVQTVRVVENQSCRVIIKLHKAFLQMGQMVVTATRSEKNIQDVAVMTEVIASEEIRERGAENLAQVLKDCPGMTVEPNSSGGLVLRMNGLDGKHVLFLQDGVPVAGKMNSRVELNLMDVDQLDRIEIVKGPGSALYGSEAMAGVVNLITHSVADHWQASAGVRCGSYDLYSGHVSVSGTRFNVGVAAGLDYQQGGIDKNEVNIDVSEQKNQGGFIRLRWKDQTLGALAAGVDYKKNLLNSNDQDRLNRALDHETAVRRTGVHLQWEKTASERLTFKTRGYISDYFRTYSNVVHSSGFTSSIDTSRERLTGFRSDFFQQWGKKALVNLGYDYSHCSFFSVRVKDREVNRDHHGLFAQMEIKPVSSFVLTFGGRYDKITDLSGRFSPSVSAMWSLTSGLKFRTACGVGFRAPNFMDMYTDYRNPYVVVVGNPGLKAEQSQGFNAAVEYTWKDRLLIIIAASRNQFKNMIVDYVMIPGSRTSPSTLSYRNIAESVFTGFEWQGRFQASSRLSMTLNYNFTHLDVKEESGALNTAYPHTVSIHLTYGMLKNRLKLIFRNQFYSDRDIRPFDNSEVQDYQVVHLPAMHLSDLLLSYQPSNRLHIRAGVDNLLDYTNRDYGPWIGRRYFLGTEVN